MKTTLLLYRTKSILTHYRLVFPKQYKLLQEQPARKR
jgi:hypothetical protein